jgi:hypothetical protein
LHNISIHELYIMAKFAKKLKFLSLEHAV